ncbi:hypothetical protein, partial [Bradyrhizobium uaiense]
GKSQAVAATVALIAIIGSVPYIALQLKAMASSLETILSEDQAVLVLGRVGVAGTEQHREHRHRQRHHQCDVAENGNFRER